MSRSAQAQRKLEPVFDKHRDIEASDLQNDADAPVNHEELGIGRVERLLRQHPALVHEIE